MTSPESIALVRARGFGTLPQLIEARGGERLLLETFEREGVPVALCEAPQTAMPLAAMINLFSSAARRLGDRLLGLDVGADMTHSAYGLWVEHAAQARTLGDALQRAVTTCWAHQSGSYMELVPAGSPSGSHVVIRFVSTVLTAQAIQHADHMLLPMRTFVRLFLGASWQPDWFEVAYPRDQDAGLLEDRLGVPVHFSCPGTGLALKVADLARPGTRLSRPGNRIVTPQDLRADMILQDAPEPASSLSAVIALRLLDGQSDIEGAARLAGLSVQTLQRRLRLKGYTYRDILSAVRHRRALDLLTEAELPVVEIALALGYEDHASFTHAFTRWTGRSPAHYRAVHGPRAGGGPARRS